MTMQRTNNGAVHSRRIMTSGSRYHISRGAAGVDRARSFVGTVHVRCKPNSTRRTFRCRVSISPDRTRHRAPASASMVLSVSRRPMIPAEPRTPANSANLAASRCRAPASTRKPCNLGRRDSSRASSAIGADEKHKISPKTAPGSPNPQLTIGGVRYPG